MLSHTLRDRGKMVEWPKIFLESSLLKGQKLVTDDRHTFAPAFSHGYLAVLT